MTLVGISSCAVISLALCGSCNSTQAGTIGFDDYVSASDNQLSRDFIQEPNYGSQPPFYFQSATGGVTGGSVSGYSGQNYRATAVYQSLPLTFSGTGSAISLSMDLFYGGSFIPLISGANAVRSFRLGLLTSPLGSFETVGDAGLYIGGVYSLSLHTMELIAYSATDRTLSNIGVGEAVIPTNHWVRMTADFSEIDSSDYSVSTALYDLGTSGASIPALLGSGLYFSNGGGDPNLTNGKGTFSNTAINSPLYASFSILSDGGISKGDNLAVPGTGPGVQQVPEPSTTLLLTPLVLAIIRIRKACRT